MQYLCVPRKRYVVSIINTSFTVCLEHMDCYHTVVSSTLHCVLLFVFRKAYIWAHGLLSYRCFINITLCVLFVFSKAYTWAHGLHLEPLRRLLQVCLWQLLELCTDPAGSGTDRYWKCLHKFHIYILHRYFGKLLKYCRHLKLNSFIDFIDDCFPFITYELICTWYYIIHYCVH